MARVKNNIVTHGFSGKLGDLLVFIQRFGKTFVGKVPARSDKVSEDQQAIRIKFDRAAKYARASIQNPDTKALYAKKAGGGVTAYNLAFADYFTPPQIIDINTDEYSGAIGSTIVVFATDDTKVAGVQVSITAANGTVLEEGKAIAADGTDLFVYTATKANLQPAGSKIVAAATDLPGNTSSAEKLL